VDVHVPDTLGYDSVPGRPDNLVLGERGGKPAVEAGVQQSIVEERSGVRDASRGERHAGARRD
jgi:hypothetical protein